MERITKHLTENRGIGTVGHSPNKIIQKLADYEDAEQHEYIKRCEKCGSLKVNIFIDEDYFSNPLRCKCAECKAEWAG